MKEERRIAKVYTWDNGMVMVFDQYGEQMPEYQGRVEHVMERIRRDAPSGTYFSDAGHWYYRPSMFNAKDGR